MIDGAILYGVGRNLNRCIRTCYSFGVYNIYLYKCKNQDFGNLYSAKESVTIHVISEISDDIKKSSLALEKLKSLKSIDEINNTNIKYIVIGGESTTLKKQDWPNMAKINTVNDLCLTSEAALAIALFSLLNI